MNRVDRFLISQNIESLVRMSRQVLIDLSLNTGLVRELNYLPIQVVSEFTLVPGASNKVEADTPSKPSGTSIAAGIAPVQFHPNCETALQGAWRPD